MKVSRKQNASRPVKDGVRRAKKSKAMAEKELKAATVATLKVIGAKLFAEQPVWSTTAFDYEVAARWQKKTGQRVEDYDKLVTGRNRFMNLVDWVKAHFTESHRTMKVSVRGQEYRVWLGVVGYIRSDTLVTLQHFADSMQTLAKLISSSGASVTKEVATGIEMMPEGDGNVLIEFYGDAGRNINEQRIKADGLEELTTVVSLTDYQIKHGPKALSNKLKQLGKNGGNKSCR